MLELSMIAKSNLQQFPIAISGNGTQTPLFIYFSAGFYRMRYDYKYDDKISPSFNVRLYPDQDDHSIQKPLLIAYSRIREENNQRDFSINEGWYLLNISGTRGNWKIFIEKINATLMDNNPTTHSGIWNTLLDFSGNGKRRSQPIFLNGNLCRIKFAYKSDSDSSGHLDIKVIHEDYEITGKGNATELSVKQLEDKGETYFKKKEGYYFFEAVSFQGRWRFVVEQEV